MDNFDSWTNTMAGLAVIGAILLNTILVLVAGILLSFIISGKR